jgi:hypothetical protein
VGHRAGPDVFEKKKISCPCQDSNPLLSYHLNTRSRDSSVGIVTGLWAGRSGVRGAHSSALQNRLRGSSASWMKGAGRDVDNSPPSSVKGTNGAVPLFPPYAFTAWTRVNICCHFNTLKLAALEGCLKKNWLQLFCPEK